MQYYSQRLIAAALLFGFMLVDLGSPKLEVLLFSRNACDSNAVRRFSETSINSPSCRTLSLNSLHMRDRRCCVQHSSDGVFLSHLFFPF